MNVNQEHFRPGPARISSWLTCLLVCSFASACRLSAGIVDADPDPGTAVKLQPLAGTIDGRAFTAKVAIAQPDGAVMNASIFTSAATCDDWPKLQPGDLEIELEVDGWATGWASELGEHFMVDFVEQKSGGQHLFVIKSGRVEVSDPGSTTANGTLSIRAMDADYGSVEGQVPVIVCSP